MNNWQIPRPLVITIMAAGGLLAIPSLSCAPTRRSETQESVTIESYRQGVAEAMQEIRAGKPTIYSFGLNTPPGADRETGLPYKRVGTDVVGSDLLWRVLGHNDAVKSYL